MATVVIIGAGNVAYHLVKGLKEQSVDVLQIFNRSRRGLARIRRETGVAATTRINQIVEADCYIIAVNDDAIKDVSENLSTHIDSNSLIAHTSGNCTIKVFEKHFVNYGSFYPLQTFNKNKDVNWKNIPIFVSSSNRSSSIQLKKLGGILTEQVVTISDKRRAQLHIPAVMVNNFVNHIYAVAFDICKKHDLSFEHLIPLMEETLDSIKQSKHPANNQTGPAVRGDLETIKGHRTKLKESTGQLKLYNYITNHIKEYHENR